MTDMNMKKLIALLSLMCAVFTFCTVGSAHAADRFSVIDVHPNADLGHYFFVQEAETLPQLGWNVGMLTRYDYRLLDIKFLTTVVTPGGGTTTTETHNGIDNLIYQYFYASFGITDRVALMIDFPLYYAFKYGWTTPTTTTNSWFYFKPGDIWLYAKFNLYDIAKHRVGIALIPAVSFPTGDDGKFLGDVGVTGEAKLVVEGRPNDTVRMAFTTAFQTRENVDVNDISFRDTLKFAFGLNYAVVKDVGLIAEIEAHTATRNFFSERRTSPVEARLGARWYPQDSGLTVGGGLAAGLVHGAGAPLVAGFVSVGYNGQSGKKDALSSAP